LSGDTNGFHARREVGKGAYGYWKQKVDARSRPVGVPDGDGDGKIRIEVL